MINNELKKVIILSYDGQIDSYGQKRTDTPTEREVEMYVKIHSQSLTTDVRYVEVEMIGLTKDNTITDANQVKIDGVIYNIEYVIPSSRYNQILMKKK